MNVTVLVDFENDSVRTALAVAAALGPRLWGVRLDTSDRLADARARSGSTATRRRRASRRSSSGSSAPSSTSTASTTCASSSPAASTPTRIRAFEAEGVPVDAYGVGSSLIRGANDFTADVVMVDGEPCAKVRARADAPNPRLEPWAAWQASHAKPPGGAQLLERALAVAGLAPRPPARRSRPP